jgi:hypothetical protein
MHSNTLRRYPIRRAGLLSDRFPLFVFIACDSLTAQLFDERQAFHFVAALPMRGRASQWFST